MKAKKKVIDTKNKVMKTENSVNFTADPKIRKLLQIVPLTLDYRNSSHILCFRNIIELAWTKFHWNGQVPGVS